MKAAILCIIGLLGAKAHAADPLVEGHVRLPSGAPVPGAQVLLFDLSDLRAAPLTTTTDQSGHFTLPLAALAGVLRSASSWGPTTRIRSIRGQTPYRSCLSRSSSRPSCPTR